MFYRFAKCLVKFYIRVLFRVQVEGEIPEEGPFLLCANHTSLYDPVTVACFTERQLTFMAKRELFDIFGLKWILKWVGAFPVTRDKGSIGAVKTSLSILRQGGVMLMFPEGRRNRSAQHIEAKAGMVLIAQRANVPIIPIGIRSSYKPFSKLRIVYGKPISLEEYKAQKLSAEQMDRIAETILDEIYSLAEK